MGWLFTAQNLQYLSNNTEYRYVLTVQLNNKYKYQGVMQYQWRSQMQQTAVSRLLMATFQNRADTRFLEVRVNEWFGVPLKTTFQLN